MSYNSYKSHAKILSAISNPKRLEILHVLKSRCVRVSELAQMTGLNQPNISQHMHVLRREGIVVTKRKGREIEYCISHPKIISILENLTEILSDKKIVNRNLKHNRMPNTPILIDPVCGMKVSAKHAIYTHTHKRTTYYFCASGCKKRFVKKPDVYV